MTPALPHAVAAAVLCGLVGWPAHSAEAPPEGPGLGALLESFRSLGPAEPGAAVAEERILRIGHLEVKLVEGVLYPLAGQGGEVLGLLFSGRGVYAYRSDHPRDRALLEVNVSRNAPSLTLQNDTVGDAFDGFVMFFATPLFQEHLQGADRPLSAEALAQFERMWKQIGLTYLEYDHLAAEARLNGGEFQYVYAEFAGQREPVGYTYDRVRSFRERLWAFRKIQGVDVRFIENLSAQDLPAPPGGEARADLRHARIEVSTDDNRTGTIAGELTLEPRRPGTRVLALGLINNRDPRSYSWASTRNALRLRSVTGADGVPLEFSHRYHELLVQLPRPSSAGEKLVLRFDSEGEIFTDLDGERVDNFFELFADSWFPRPTGWDASPYTWEVRVRTRKPFYPVASGTTVALRGDGDHYQLESRSSKPVRDPAIFAGKYRSVEEKAGDITIRVHAYAMANEFVMKTLPGLSRELIRYYSDQLGPYPFEELDVVEIPTYWMGIAPSGMVLLPTQAYKPTQDWLAGYLARGAPSIVAHEIAHQWFGHGASPAAPEEWWLSESFAEYLAGLALGAGETDERRVAGFKTMFAGWQAETRSCPGAALEAASWLGGEAGSRDRWCLLYNKGPLVLHMLRTTVGEQRFFAILRRFLETSGSSPASTDDLKRAASEVVGMNLDWFFDQWVRQGGIPEIRVTHRLEASGGGFVLAGAVQQADGPGFKKMVIPLVLDYADGRREAKVFIQETPVQEFRFELREKPRKVTVDPAQNNLAVYR